MIIQTKNIVNDTVGDMSTFERSNNTHHHLTTMTRIVGVCTAVGILSPRDRGGIETISFPTSTLNEEGMMREKHSAFHYRMKVVCGVGADVAYHRHVMGLYVTVASGAIFFLEVTWAITLFVQLCVRNEDSFCSHCWSNVLTTTRGWRRALLYLPLSCVLAWRPNRLWLSYVAAGLLAILSLLHIASSVLGRRNPCQSNAGTDSVGESLLNSRQDNYDRFEEVLVTEVLDDGVSGSGRCPGDSDGEI